MEQREREARGMAEESDPSANPGSTHYVGMTSRVYCYIQDTAHTGYSGAAIPRVEVAVCELTKANEEAGPHRNSRGLAHDSSSALNIQTHHHSPFHLHPFSAPHPGA